MAHGNWKGKGLMHPEFRSLFSPKAILSSDWYKLRLDTRIEVTKDYWKKRINYLEEFLKDHVNREASERLGIQERLNFSKDALSRLDDKPGAIKRIHGCLGTDPGIYE
jgi:hypothetical protein